ncbi:uncharacterized protein LOC127860852 isoform X2 [Dreissena polymorpha]|uniref:uncharacterized protein LOC127860852 isoform X2 n=1 Tax=Dreissena polymorpha TaxID=45954 RepID=UPI002264B7DF|nr:uncharacterized protein LOC127860852 isoform X2 [Dreissena polymorpha]XP_052255112.1 uncharacterized protein LOC127860852 isoform X2 [Dreissena polymorpha]
MASTRENSMELKELLPAGISEKNDTGQNSETVLTTVTDHEGRPLSPENSVQRSELCKSFRLEMSNLHLTIERQSSSRRSSRSQETAASSASEPTILSRCFKCCKSGQRAQEEGSRKRSLQALPINMRPTSKGTPHYCVQCDVCNVAPIRGTRWKCSDCLDYDMCSTCYEEKREQHDMSHPFIKKEPPAFYKKIYKSGCINFMKGNERVRKPDVMEMFGIQLGNEIHDAEYIKINADAGDNESILQQVAEGVVDKLWWYVRHINLLLSVTDGADELDEDGRNAFTDGLKKMLQGTCMVTVGTNDGVTQLVGDAVSVFNKNKKRSLLRERYCPTIGIVCMDRIQNKDTLKLTYYSKLY